MDWLKAHGFQVFLSFTLVAIAIGQWRGELIGANQDIDALDRRVSFLEDRLMNEQQRLSSIYMTRELSVSQFADIGRQLEEIKTELRVIRRQGQ